MGRQKYKESIVRDLLTELLISKGFYRIRANWRRETEHAYHLANIQRSTYGPHFYLNFAIFFKEVEPGVVPHRAFGHLTFRAGDQEFISQDGIGFSPFKSKVSKTLDEAQTLSITERCDFINGQMWDAAELLFAKFSTVKQACEHVHRPRKEQLVPRSNRELLHYCGVAYDSESDSDAQNNL